MYIPVWEGPIEGYTVNYMKRHRWRVARTMEWEDIMQECQCLFLKLCREYEDEYLTRRMFMGLYKTSLRNLIHDLSKEDTYFRECTCESDLGDEDQECLDARISSEENEGTLGCMIEDAPDEVRAVMSLFLNARPEVYASASAAWRAVGRKKEHGNAFLCAMLGLDEKVNVVRLTREYFLGG